MQNKEAYNQWSATYDEVTNKTRDKEAIAFRAILSKHKFSDVIELGCGTGKNTEWLCERSKHVLAVDFSEEMVNAAKKKISSTNVDFVIADITTPWSFINRKVDLVTCSLILEHIENIDLIFQEVSQHLEKSGIFYIGELHPFKQYMGSKARFERDSELFVLECYTHHVSEYMNVAMSNHFSCLTIAEWFDDEDRSTPRIISFVFQKN